VRGGWTRSSIFVCSAAGVMPIMCASFNKAANKAGKVRGF
jgi:hypothetical protein